MKNAINWFEIYTSDFKRAKKFYTEVLGCTLTDVPLNNDRHSGMEYAVFQSDENSSAVGGALVKIEEAMPGIGGTMVYFDIEDINVTLSKVEANGGKIMRPKSQVGDFGFIALIEDSEGNMIGFRSLK